jgi:hypothetical protein
MEDQMKDKNGNTVTVGSKIRIHRHLPGKVLGIVKTPQGEVVRVAVYTKKRSGRARQLATTGYNTSAQIRLDDWND